MSDARRENNKGHYDKESTSIARLFVSSLKSALLALAISFLLAALLCGAAALSADPMTLIFPMSMAALYISSFLSGFFCMRKMGEGALLSGLFSGGLFMLMNMFITLFFKAEMSASHPFAISLLLHSLIIVFSILGAFAGRHRSSKKRRIKR